MSEQSERPHILLITTDQQRGDCLGLEGHPVLQTPNLDWLGRRGTFFRRGYSECPSCIPARRVLMTGQAPDANGLVGFAGFENYDPPHTLAGELTHAGYQTEMIGKLHLYPRRKRYGFEHLALADASHSWSGDIGENEYVDWLRARGKEAVEPGVAHGVDSNGWVGRPSHLPEEEMHTYWCVSKAIEFLERRDPTAPFFLNLSLVDPHPPLTPPQLYYDRYVREELPTPIVGDWVDWLPEAERGLNVAASRVHLDEKAMHYARAAYYGMINFVDDQLGRLFHFLRRRGMMNDTLILFSSDHGEMLGDHHMFRKTFAYEASARVPFLAKAPAGWEYPECETYAPVGWQDIMPTLLAAAGAPIPDCVTGKSLLPLMRGEEEKKPRAVLHGEHAGCYAYTDGVQFLTDGHQKYIWYTQTGQEQLFDLDSDPNEIHDLARQPEKGGVLAVWRRRLIAQLKDRPEAFSDGEKLIVGQEHRAHMPRRATA
jgi:arylsulfatase A-like enzyme